MDLRILSGGAANGLVTALTPAFRDAGGVGISGDFGAVGGMRERVLAGEAVDVVILTRAVVGKLAEAGHVDPSTVVDVGEVATGVAVRADGAAVDIRTPKALTDALTAADAIYLPDPDKATAGIHFARVLADLGIAASVAARLRPFPNGQTAMATMAASRDRQPIGCTQITEILNTPGVRYCGALPDPHGLLTTYTASVTTRAADPVSARAFVALLTGAQSAEVRSKAGFGT